MKSQTDRNQRRAGNHARRNALVWMLLLAGLATGLLGCTHPRARVLVPHKETAAEQYAYALKYRNTANLELIRDQQEFQRKREILKQTFERVIEHYPNDRQFTPLARLEVVEMNAGLDFQRVQVSEKQMHKAIQQLEELAQAYPEMDFIQAKCRYSQGQIHKRLGEFEPARQAFLEVRDRFMNHSNEVIQDLARRSAYWYDMVYVEE